MRCSLCRGEMIRSTTTLPYKISGGHIVVVKYVPALVCRQCGESFIEIEIVRKLEHIVDAAEKSDIISGFITYKEAA